ncbi:glycosyltransferase [Photobacterium leiognathi]|uniref:glycosyltransferase n=1 Tax=Photobacterium leiognathi TaxID=553611 RepID=UPI002982634D|nr:glycosyltransferase [Photobacterium leiognathi]
MSKFLFVNNALNGTGGPRVILNLADALINNGHEVSIVVDRIDNVNFEINPKISLYKWDCLAIKKVEDINKIDLISGNEKKTNKKTVIPSLAKKILRSLRDIKYSLLSPIYAYTLSRFVELNNIDVIANSNIYIGVERHFFCSKLIKNYLVSYHNSPVEVFSRQDYFEIIKKENILRKIDYVCVSNAIQEELFSLGFDVNFSKVIYNAFDFTSIHKLSTVTACNLNKPYILSISTLTERKRVDRVISAYSLLKEIHESFDLVILGEGHLDNDLKDLCKNLKVDDKVKFLGFQSNPYVYLLNSSALVLASDSEGLPTVIIEALVLGTPVISTDCPTGPREILSDWGDDVLVKLGSDEEIISDISNKLNSLLAKDLSRDHVFNFSNLSRFEKSNVIKEWESIC